MTKTYLEKVIKKYWWLFLVVVPLISITLAGFRVYYAIAIWEYRGPDIIFEIKSGEPFSSINGKLYRNKLINSAKVFYRYSKYNNLMTSLKSGRFNIPSNSTMLDIIEILTKGKALTIKVTIPEGKNIYEIGRILESKKIIGYDKFISKAKDQQFAFQLGVPLKTVEGYLYPDTYQFTEKMEAKDVIKTMVKLFNKRTKHLNFSANPQGLSKEQVIILASVVEKETGAGHERPIIAGVFYNRLKKRMRLQSDPTTIYGIFENFNGNLRKKHLLEKNPYNTYKIPALPIGPISNPGLQSLRAVLNPDSHNYLYFVSQNDGTHVFTSTYKEHLKAVNQYQKNAKARRGKSWRDLNKKN